MMTSISTQLSDLVKLCSDNCNSRGSQIVLMSEEATRLELLWLHYLNLGQLTGTANCLLEGARSAIHESVSCIALGLVRPALNSLRLQIDLILGWLYFKDHPVEWSRVQASGDGFKMKLELLKYLSESYERYGTRFGILRDCKTRTQDDPYRLLSAHIHGQSQYVLPQVLSPSDIVASISRQDEAVRLQRECSEYVNDVLWSVFADRWSSIPTDLRTALEKRFVSDAQRTTFYASVS